MPPTALTTFTLRLSFHYRTRWASTKADERGYAASAVGCEADVWSDTDEQDLIVAAAHVLAGALFIKTK
jgi:hypothetical protein